MILVCGEALFDVFLTDDRGASLQFDARPGGSPFNVAVGLARLGQRVGFFGGLSTDLLGARLLRVLEDEGVDTDWTVRRARPTTLSIVGLGIDGAPVYAFYGEQAADRAVEVRDLPVIPDGVRAIHLGSFSTVVEPVGHALEALVRREVGSRLIAYDPNVRATIEPDLGIWRRKLEAFARSVHLLKISSDDFALLFAGADPADLARTWINLGVRLVVLTQGARGASAWTPGGTVAIPASSVHVADTVGAGDAFQAALLAGLAEMTLLSASALAGIPQDALIRLLDFANKAAASTCSRRGADPPERSELPRLVEA
jgi:fructokinase